MRKRDSTKRINLWVAQDFIDFIHALSDKHIPQPTKTEFYIHIIKSGLNSWDEGNKIKKPSQFKFVKPGNKFQHYISITLIQRFYITLEKTEPKPMVHHFFLHILKLGVEAYQKEYDEFGIKRD